MPDPLLLPYMFATDPAPLMASGPATPQQGRIHAGVSGQGVQVYCDKILIAVPIGDTATDAYLQPPSCSVNTPRWVAQPVQWLSGDQLGLHDTRPYAAFPFVPRDPTDDLISYSLVLGLDGNVSPASGTFNYAVQEHSGTTPDRSKYATRQGVYTLTKSTVQLYLRNLVATTQDRQTVPVTQVAAGTPLLLKWSSSGTWFQLYAGDQQDPVYQGRDKFVSLDKGITRDTTFFLLASATGDPGSDQGQGGYQTIYAYATLSLTVTEPTLPSLTLAGTLKAGGAEVASLAATNLIHVGDIILDKLATLANVNVQGQATFRTIRADAVVLTANDNVAVWAMNHSGQNGSGRFSNGAPGDPGAVTGVTSLVAQQNDTGFWTNGRISSAAGQATLTHLPTRNGYRVVTSPLVTDPEVHISGSAQLADGRARVDFEPELADLICHSDEVPYRVFVTATGPCAGLAVVEKASGHFIVEEAAKGRSDAPFDWMVIARQRADQQAADATAAASRAAAMELPTTLPKIPQRPAVPT